MQARLAGERRLDNMLKLLCHPESSGSLVGSIEVNMGLEGDGRLWIRYYTPCPLDSVETLAPADPVHTDGLWKSTCFELFMRKAGEEAYLEFNFAPSGQWAAYHFESYRDGMRPITLPRVPAITLDAGDGYLSVEASLDLPSEYSSDAWEAGVSVVIEETDGTKSFWALKHPPGKPDFHHKSCFAAKLLPPEIP